MTAPRTPVSPAPVAGSSGAAGAPVMAPPPAAAAARREPVQYSGSYRWVYLWHLPLRAMHWIAAASVVALLVTGLLIARPVMMAGTQRATFALQWVRLVHFAAAGVFVATAIVRVYLLFVGNRFERWKALFPVRRSDWVNLWRTVGYYVLVQRRHPPRYLGHNPLQQLLYTSAYAVALVMVVTGFILFGQANPGGLVNTAFGWMTPYLGGAQWVRVIHHALSWFFLLFIIIHVYFAIRSDILERGGMVSSMVSGGRFVAADERHEDE